MNKYAITIQLLFSGWALISSVAIVIIKQDLKTINSNVLQCLPEKPAKPTPPTNNVSYRIDF